MFGLADAPFTLDNTIYVLNTNLSIEPDTLVHECVHVWQYQNIGTRYTTDALGAMAIYGRDAPYNWEAELARGNTDWSDFNREAQAQLIQDVWNFGTLTFNGHTTAGNGCFFDLQEVQSKYGNGIAEFNFNGVDRTKLATAATNTLRGTINVRFSGNL